MTFIIILKREKIDEISCEIVEIAKPRSGRPAGTDNIMYTPVMEAICLP